MKLLLKFAFVHASLHNHFSLKCGLIGGQTYKACRSAALTEWRNLAA